VALLVLGVTALHYLTTTQRVEYHDIFRRLYYVPIVLGGLWFTLRGGLATSVVVSALYAPHVIFQWGHHPGIALEQYLEIVLYNVIGFLTGFLAERERIQTVRARRAAQKLERSYAKLRNQADQILEVEAQLRRADRLSALGELAAGMAHEIRNPLGSIRGTAEILQEGVDPQDRRYEFGRILLKEVDRLNKVVQNFLDFARPSEPERERVDVNETLRDVFALTRQPAARDGIEVIFEAGDVASATGSAKQLQQAFLNLVLNALQAMPRGGRLKVTTAQAAGEVRIVFADTGHGISGEDQDKVFNPFFTTRQEGTGLGLAITHRIVQGHGGRIEVKSRPGEGTDFTMILPCAGSGGGIRA